MKKKNKKIAVVYTKPNEWAKQLSGLFESKVAETLYFFTLNTTCLNFIWNDHIIGFQLQLSERGKKKKKKRSLLNIQLNSYPFAEEQYYNINLHF